MRAGQLLAKRKELKAISNNKKNNGCIAIANELERPSNLEELFTLFSKQGLEYPPLVILDGITLLTGGRFVGCSDVWYQGYAFFNPDHFPSSQSALFGK